MEPVSQSPKRSSEIQTNAGRPEDRGRYNGHDIMVVKARDQSTPGTSHADTDDFFHRARRAEMRDRPRLKVPPEDPGAICIVVPKDVESPARRQERSEAHLLLIERRRRPIRATQHRPGKETDDAIGDGHARSGQCQLRHADPEQCRSVVRQAGAEGAGEMASGLYQLVERPDPAELPGVAWSICAPPVSVDPKGWAKFDYVKMPEYRWGILLAPQVEDRTHPLRRAFRRAGLAGGAGRIPRDAAPADRDPGRHRAGLGRAAAPSGPDRAVALRHAQPLPGQCRGRPPPLGHGLPAAEIFRPRRPRGGRRAAAPLVGFRGSAAHAGRLQRGDAGLAVLLHVHLFHRPIPCHAPAGSC